MFATAGTRARFLKEVDVYGDYYYKNSTADALREVELARNEIFGAIT